MKGRAWAFLVYPESCPDNWKEILLDTGLPFAISPLHDKDVEPTGELKKPHYHVITYYENPTTYNNVNNNVCKLVNGTIPKKLESIRGMYRYHLHLDNPEKYQYDDRDRDFIGPFDVSKINELTQTEVQKLLSEIIKFIVNNQIYEYSDLVDYIQSNDLFELFYVVSHNTIFITAYLCSRRNKLKDLANLSSCNYLLNR